ncbi:MAG: nucleoside triphosphate pyrophosphohydrolase [Treponema sp.]|jgi:tetrapyrrole methylase family protein/MazG family protein|nr:nucleoside triphosphate pyrophosphohydrolase [Treponema sp.]
MNVNEAYQKLYDVVVKLRGPDGCPWDKEQNPSSLREDLIEETYECIEAIDTNNGDHICEELGDLFLLTTMIAYMHEQKGNFTVADSLEKISEKLIRRHPHVFGDVKVKDSEEVLNNWAAIKIEQEGRKPKDSLLDEVSAGLPPMERAWKLQKKAAKAGFDWPDLKGVLVKIDEELDEVRETTEVLLSSDPDNYINANKVEEELGDLLFSIINLCRFIDIEPSTALHRANAKFIERFKYVEKKMKETNQEMKKGNLKIMDSFWNEAKNEKKKKDG